MRAIAALRRQMHRGPYIGRRKSEEKGLLSKSGVLFDTQAAGEPFSIASRTITALRDTPLVFAELRHDGLAGGAICELAGIATDRSTQLTSGW